MKTLDYIVIGFYLVFMLILGPVYRRFNRTASDYFRGGGGMLWWMVGVSGFMTTFTAWSFTGGAAKAYETGTFFLLLFACNFVALIFTYFFTAARFRQMRVITGVEAIRKRFDRINEQFHTWVPVPFFVMFGGIGLYTIAIFMSVVFNVHLVLVIVTLGVVVTIMSVMGGSWAIIASDFLQMLTVVTITIFMTILVLARQDIGGLAGLIEKLPRRHFDWTEFDRPWVIVVFAVTLLINQVVQMNSMTAGAAKYVFCKNGRDAKKATLIQMVGFLIMSPIWLIPALAAVILHPNLAAEYPKLNNPNEAAYVATAITLLPAGMMGLLVAGMFAATMSSMDSGLNRSAGIIVRNFYLPVINPQASEARQIQVGKWVTALFGFMMILVGVFFSSIKSLPLFDLILLCAAAIGIPTAVPLFLGMFVKKAPSWAGWSTPIIGFAASLLLHFALNPDRIQALFSTRLPLKKQELGDLNIAVTTAVLFAVCTGWFLLSTLWARKRRPEEVASTEEFFRQMNTPVNLATEHVPDYDNDRRQHTVLGRACLAYGGFICLLALLPNTLTGRAGFLFCGGIMAGIGGLLCVMGARIRAPAESAAPAPAARAVRPVAAGDEAHA